MDAVRLLATLVIGVRHPAGRYRAGDPSDPNAVVDPCGRVMASENPYVADALVMPRLHTANVNTSTEKISAGLLSWIGQNQNTCECVVESTQSGWTISGPVREGTCLSQGAER